uniref:Uncharacterized protein n=1 Tax=Glossina pallidipes TaxID=7398 RepID=A0A1B0A7T6_GLOPL
MSSNVIVDLCVALKYPTQYRNELLRLMPLKYLPVAKARLDKFNSPLRRANFNNFSVNIVLSSEGSRLRNIGFKLRNVGRSLRRGGARERRQNDSAEVCGFELAADILRCILTICVYSFTYVIPLKQ